MTSIIAPELFALLEQTADAAYTVTDGGEICSWNRPAEALFGYSASEVGAVTSMMCFRHGTRWAPERSRVGATLPLVVPVERPLLSRTSTSMYECVTETESW